MTKTAVHEASLVLALLHAPVLRAYSN